MPQQREDSDQEGGAYNQRWSEHGQVLHGLTLLPTSSAAACEAAATTHLQYFQFYNQRCGDDAPL
jgi:hypothetical protein